MQFPPNVEQWRYLVQQYFPQELVDKALWTIMYESGGDPNAVGDNGVAQGLFQIQDQTRFSNRPPAKWLQDPENNIRYAAQQLGAANGNFSAWGENTLYQGKVFGALGNHPFPGGPVNARAQTTRGINLQDTVRATPGEEESGPGEGKHLPGLDSWVAPPARAVGRFFKNLTKGTASNLQDFMGTSAPQRVLEGAGGYAVAGIPGITSSLGNFLGEKGLDAVQDWARDRKTPKLPYSSYPGTYNDLGGQRAAFGNTTFERGGSTRLTPEGLAAMDAALAEGAPDTTYDPKAAAAKKAARQRSIAPQVTPPKTIEEAYDQWFELWGQFQTASAGLVKGENPTTGTVGFGTIGPDGEFVIDPVASSLIIQIDSLEGLIARFQEMEEAGITPRGRARAYLEAEQGKSNQSVQAYSDYRTRVDDYSGLLQAENDIFNQRLTNQAKVAEMKPSMRSGRVALRFTKPTESVAPMREAIKESIPAQAPQYYGVPSSAYDQAAAPPEDAIPMGVPGMTPDERLKRLREQRNAAMQSDLPSFLTRGLLSE